MADDVGPYSISFLGTDPMDTTVSVYSYGTALIAHEIGHNLGGRHTFDCYWHEGNGFAIENASCDPGTPNSSCVSSCTITTGYEATIMSYCWPDNNNDPDYNSPFHFLVAQDILLNLCTDTLCYPQDTVICQIDNDFDGFCAGDPNECDDENPNRPGIEGMVCNDNKPHTVNDIFIQDSLPIDSLSCNCVGTQWNNDGQDPCNFVVEGVLDFENDDVGYYQGTWYNGFDIGWTGANPPSGNTPEIGHYRNAANICDNYMAMLGRWNPNSGGFVSTKEGFAVMLSSPLPAKTGVLNISVNYSLYDSEPNRKVLHVQGSDSLATSLLPVDCDTMISNPVVCFGNFIEVDSSMQSTHGALELDQYVQNLFNPHDCDFQDMAQEINIQQPVFASETFQIRNNHDTDINYLYFSINVIEKSIREQAYLLLDNISIEVDPESYPSVLSQVDECDVEFVTYSPYCSYELQYLESNAWITLEKDVDYSVSQTTPSVNSEGFQVVTDMLDYSFANCRPHRILQTCPPSPSGENNCNNSVFELSLEDCSVCDGLTGFTCPVDTSSLIINADILGKESISSWLTGNNPIPNSLGIMTGLTIYIKGTLEIDVNVRFLNCHLFFEPDAQIITQGGDLRILNESILEACTDGWRGLSIGSGEKLIVKNSTIMNAVDAVRMHTNSDIKLVENEFIGNINSLFVLGNIVNSGLRSNRIIGGNSGIILNDVSFFVYPTDNNGQILPNFSTTPSNANFSSIDSCNYGVKLNNSVGYIEGLSISNCNTAYETNGMCSLSCESSIITDCELGINLTSDSDMSLIHFSKCAILNEDDMIESNGIKIIESDGTQFSFTNGEISRMEESVKIDKSRLSRAHFYNDSITQNLGSNTFIISNSSEVKVYNNNAPIDHGGSTCFKINQESKSIVIEEVNFNAQDNFIGTMIESTSSDQISLRSNDFNLQEDQGSSVKSTNGTNWFICGNEMNNGDRGIWFKDSEASNFQFRQNTMSNVGSNSFLNKSVLVSDKDIGVQRHHGNIWDNSTSSFVEIDIDPSGSEFIYNGDPSSGGNDEYSPTDIKVPPNNIPSEWFQNLLGAHINIDCHFDDDINEEPEHSDPEGVIGIGSTKNVENPCEKRKAYIESIASSEFILDKHPVQAMSMQLSLLQWLNEKKEYGSKYKLPEECWDEIKGQLENFEVNIADEQLINLARLNSIYRQAVELNLIEKADLKNYHDIIEESLDNLLQMNNQTDAIVIESEILKINNVRHNIEMVKQSFLEDRLNKKEYILEEISALYGTDILFNNYVKILEIKTKLIGQNIQHLNASDKMEIIELANKCVYDYGRPVYLARSFYKQLGGQSLNAYQDDIICTPLETRYQSKNDLNVYPNPTSGELTVSLMDGIFENAIISIYSISGIREFRSELINNVSSYKMDVQQFPIGIHYLEVESSTGIRFVKFVKTE